MEEQAQARAQRLNLKAAFYYNPVIKLNANESSTPGSF